MVGRERGAWRKKIMKKRKKMKDNVIANRGCY
jgi:hypothetical protein